MLNLEKRKENEKATNGYSQQSERTCDFETNKKWQTGHKYFQTLEVIEEIYL